MEKNIKPKNKFNIKNILKYTIILALFVISYFCSYHLYGSYVTNKRIVYLIIFGFSGFIAFFAVYYTFYFFSYLSYEKARKRQANEVVNCDDKASNILKDEKYKFKYNVKISFTENIKTAYEQGKSLVFDISKQTGKEGEYFYLNYTVYDALTIFGNAIIFMHDKIDGVFKALRIQDKPIGFIEKYLYNLIEKEKTELNIEEKPVKKQGLISKVKSGFINVGIFLFKGKIEGAINDIFAFLALESYKTYTKNIKQEKLSISVEDVEVENA